MGDFDQTPQSQTELRAYHWQLVEVSGTGNGWFTSESPTLVRPVVLDFGEKSLSLSGLCNHISAGYSIEGSHISVGLAVSTQMACTEKLLMQLESHLTGQLTQIQTWQLQSGGPAPRLLLHIEGGSEWHLKGVPTDETRFGTAGEQLFLEVGPQPVACPKTGHRQCLQVREIHYDKDGMVTARGPWHPYAGSIEGYEHEAGMRDVLRIKRYRAGASGAGATSVDVLDSVVSSGFAR